MRGNAATFLEKEVVARILAKAEALGQPLSRDALYATPWLNIGKRFRKAGWDVCHDTPGFNESYQSTYRFTAHRD